MPHKHLLSKPLTPNHYSNVGPKHSAPGPILNTNAWENMQNKFVETVGVLRQEELGDTNIVGLRELGI